MKKIQNIFKNQTINKNIWKAWTSTKAQNLQYIAYEYND